MHYDTIVIGAGPAGLFAAQMLAEMNKKVLLLERNKQAGKKLLIAGAGQCNFTHEGDMQHFLACYGEHGKFLKKAFGVFDNQQCRKFFEELGISLESMPNGKVFPSSRKGTDILEALLSKCHKHNVFIEYNQLVEHIGVYDTMFTVETSNKQRYFSDHVVVATGGMSYPKTGSDGKGYDLAQAFGHTVIEPVPALTYVTIQEKLFAKLSGISFEKTKLAIWREGKKYKDLKEDSLLFTHKGLSGPAILDSARWIRQGDTLVANFMYPLNEEKVRDYFIKEIPNRGKEEILTFLRSQDLPKSFCELICELKAISGHIPCARISKSQREALIRVLTACKFKVSGLGGFNVAMATAGGVHLKEINPTTMESRKQKKLYFIGEVLDIDGNTGGYNIQAAFSTAALCAKHIGIFSKIK